MDGKTVPQKAVPPYVSYKSFINFLDNLKSQAIPQRIDRSVKVFQTMSGSLQGQLKAALVYLNLINQNGDTTAALEKLVRSDGIEREQALESILIPAYPFIFENGLELDRATHRQLEERFDQTGATRDTLRKCIAFFLKAAHGAGIKLSPHFKKVRSQKTIIKPRRKEAPISKTKPIPTEEQKTVQESKPPQQTTDESWENALLSKFPAFDPAWPDEVKSKWFVDFKALMELKKGGRL